jgi:tetratricopeptide (TPR) repeat protein
MADLIGMRLSDFEVVRELGRGGMGVVYEAIQTSLGRRVALKVLGPSLGLTPRAVERFHREAAAAAKLHHTNIVPVYATGEQDSTHFDAMELIDGPSLDVVIRQMRAGPGPATRLELPADAAATGPYVPVNSTPPPTTLTSGSGKSSSGDRFDRAAAMIADVADALHHAHQNGVTHRDIKPSNLLLSSDGRLSVTDFGLARILEQPGMTVTGEFVGTPAYMSPEQVTAGRVPVDHRSDIYSLGATLYELLTLRPPFVADGRDKLLAMVVQKEPTPPRSLDPKVPRDLETICLKCLEKDPDRRYQTAKDLADDLRRYFNRFAIRARRAGPVRRLVQWARRRPGVAASLGGLVLAVGVAIVLGYAAYRADQDRQSEREQAEARLHQEQEHARLQLLNEKVRSAYLVASSGNLKKTEEAIKEIESLGGSTGEVRLLRGVVAYFRQDAEAAINQLQQAVKLLPQSVAARALLALSYGDFGQPEKYEQVCLEMQQLTPVSPEDYLFKGYARELYEPGQSLPDVNEGIRRHDSPLGRALRAIVRSNRAIDSGRPEDSEEAIADAAVAHALLPDNQLVLYANAHARLVAAGLYQQTNQSEKRRAVLQEAARNVLALEPFIGQPNALWVIWQYYQDTGDPDRALDAARRAFKQSQTPIPAMCCVISLYLRSRYAEALPYLDQRRVRDGQGDVARGFVLAELPDGPRRAMEAYEQIARQHPPEVETYPYTNYLLLLLGRKEQVQANLRRLRLPFAVSQEWKDFYQAMRQFGGGDLSEEAFLAKVAGSRWQQCYAHFWVAMFRLADGDRAAAREHFAQAVRTRAIWEFEWNWSLVFLRRLESDTNWPPWLAMKK